MLLSSLYNKILRIRAVTTADAAVRRGVIDRCSWLLLLLLLPLLPLSSTLFFSTRRDELTRTIDSSPLDSWHISSDCIVDAAAAAIALVLQQRDTR